MSTVKDHLSDHEYDGIREYDNPTPGWWHIIFIATAVFAFFYFVYYDANPDSATIWSNLRLRCGMATEPFFSGTAVGTTGHWATRSAGWGYKR